MAGAEILADLDRFHEVVVHRAASSKDEW